MPAVVDLQDIDKAIIDVLREGRATPKYLTEETDYERYEIQRRMEVLCAAGHAHKVSTGLYELGESAQ